MQDKRKKQDIESIGPLSPQQEGLLFHALSEPARDPYFCQSCLRLEGALDLPAFEAAWFDAVARHAALRTDFKWEKLDRPVQIVFKPRMPQLDVRDWRGQSQGEQNQALRDLLAQEHAQGFDFGRAGDLRVKLIRIDANAHWLVWSYHHVSVDGWSFAAVLKDVMSAYLMRVGKPAQPLAQGETVLTPSRPYRDYVEWLRAQDANAAKAYWIDRLAGMEPPPALDLGAGESLAGQATHAEQHLHLAPQDSARVQAFARSQGVTLGTLYQGLWALLLSRCAGAGMPTPGGGRDVVFGVTVAGRPVDLDGAQDMAGLFINTVPLRVKIDDALSVSAWLGELQTGIGAMRAHEHLPLAQIQAAVQASAGADHPASVGGNARDGARRGLFDSLVVIENFPVDEALMDERATLRVATHDTGQWVGDVLFTQGRNNYAITLIVVPGAATQLVLAYDRRRFADAAVRGLLNQARTALLSLCEAGDRSLGEVRLLDDAGWHQARVHAAPRQAQAAACTALDTPLPVHALIEALAHEQPHRVAARQGEQVLSRSDLNRRAEALAARLRHAGVQTGARVALLMPRGLDTVVSMLAVLKAGAAFVPLDWRQPPARLSRLMLDSQVACVVADQGCLSDLKPQIEAALACPWISVHDLDGRAQGAVHAGLVVPAGTPVHPVRACDALPAYMVYTSGSTGEPKGVLVSHGALRRYAQAVMARLSLPDDAGMGWLSTPAADLGYTSLFGALCGGRVLHVIDEETARDPQAFSDQVAMHGIDAIKLTPSHLSGLMHAPRLSLPRHLILGGEPLSASLAARVAQLAPGTRVFNHYGPTETTVGVIAGEVTGSAGADDAEAVGLAGPLDRGLPLGWPLDHAEVWVLDHAMQPAPVGAQGEIFIGGASVAQGYWGRPGQSAERFVPNPFGEPGTRLYRTGDRGRRLSDGRIEFLGRRDSQVKIRGYRVEPEETAAWLRAQPGVTDAVVIARPMSAGDSGHRLLAYVVAEPVDGVAPDLTALRSAALNALPEAFVPAHIELLPRLPLTANGKVDQRALPDVNSAQPNVSESGDDGPRDPIEAALASIWCQVLKQARVGIHDNFFDLGGDSILNLQIIGRARKQGIRLTPKQVFEHQTIAALTTVAVTTQEAGTASVPTASAPLPTHDADALPLTAIQQWFFDRPHPQPAHWNQAIVLEVTRTLDADVLRKTLAELIRRHDALRLRFTHTQQGWRQTLAAPEAIHDGGEGLLTVLPGEAGQQVLAEAVQALHHGLDLAQGPLLRCAYRPGAGNGQAGRLWLVAHHLAVDSVSWRVLAQDLQAVYLSLAQGQALPAVEASPFAAWAKAAPRHAAAAVAEQARWLDMVDRAGPVLPGSTSAAALAANTFGAARLVKASLDADATARLIDAARRRWRCGLEDVLLAALAETLCQELDTQACLIEVESHGREALDDGLDVSRTVGWFTARHPLVLRAEHGFEPTLRAIRAERDQVPGLGQGWGLLRHLGPDAALRERLQAARPLITFNYIGHTDGLPEGGWLRWVDEPSGDHRGHANPRSHELDLDAHLSEGRLHLAWTHPGDADGVTWMFGGERVARLSETLTFNLHVLAALVADPVTQRLALRVEDFPLAPALSAPTLAQLLTCFPGLQDIYPLSPLQEGMLFHSQHDQGAAMYLNQLRVAMEGRVDLAAMDAAWQWALSRHDVLRTAFLGADQVGSGPWQVVQAHVPFHVITLDWRDLAADDAARCVQDWLLADRLEGFDPAAAPLMRVTVLHTPQGDELVWTRHHLLLDGWSTSTLLQEVLGRYAALLGACQDAPKGPQQVTDDAPACQYRDHIAWLARRDSQADMRFWAEELASLDEPSLLQAAIGLSARPAARQASADESIDDLAPSHLAVPLKPATSAGLREAARLSRVTLNTVVQAAWALVLARCTRRQEVVFGVTIAGRPADLPGVESALGLFINTVPLRTAVRPSMTLAAWWRTLQERNADLREHGHGQLAEIQTASGVKGGPLFDSVLVFENYPVDRDALQTFCAGLRVKHVEAVEIGSTPLTVVAHADETTGGLAIDLVYRPACFDAQAMGLVADMLAGVLTAFAESAESAESPEQVIGHIKLSAADDGNDDGSTATPARLSSLSVDDGLIARFQRQVERAPQARALVHGDQTWSYARLDQASSRIAHRLRTAGVCAQDPVALCLERSPAMVAAIIGVLKAGAVYVPVDPASPSERMAHIVSDSRARLVLTKGISRNVLDGLPGLTVLDLDDEESGEAVEKRAYQPPPLEGLAYVIYTSGSTGRPKGVGVTHRNVLRLFDATASRFGFGAADVWTLFHSYAFDFSVWEMWGALLHGGTLVVVPQHTARDTAAFARLLADQRVTVLNQTPSAFYRLIDELAPCKGGQPPLPHLRWVVFGGEALDYPRLRPWFERAGQGARLVNMYGITETTVHVTWRDVEAAELHPSSLIGEPLPDLELHVLDDALHPLPAGVVGELYVGGAGLARGYLGRPGLTAERFVPHPSPRTPGERLYRSGDLGRRTADGDIEYMGRADQQVKIRGFRIELGEIRAVVREHPGLRDAAVLARRMPDGGMRLVAYVVADGAVSAEDVRSHAQARLPDYMVPSAVVRVPVLPLTVNGKLDQRALPDPSQDTEQGGDARPLTPMEHQVAAVWAPLLGAQELRHGDNFFALGGHSLLATRAVAQLRAVTGLPLDVADLFTHPSVAELAALLARASARPPATDAKSAMADLLNELEQAP